MRNILKGQVYYLRKDVVFKGICLFFLLSGIILPVWLGSKNGFQMDNPLEPLRKMMSLSLILYFIIPIQACFFITEGFENGSAANLIASGQRRSSYFLGKYISEMKVIGWFIFQFCGLYLIVYIAAALLTGASVGFSRIQEDAAAVFSILGYNLLYLAAYAAIIMMAGVLVKKTATAVVITFVTVFGDFLLGGYLKDSSSALLKGISDHTLMTQILKFSGMYLSNSQIVTLSGFHEHLRTILIPILIIGVCLTVAVICFEKRDLRV